MPKLQDWLHTSERIKGSMLMPHLRGFPTPLLDDGYADATVKSKLWLLVDFGQWLRRRRFSLRDFDEKLIEAFLKNKQQSGRGDPTTLQQFLDPGNQSPEIDRLRIEVLFTGKGE